MNNPIKFINDQACGLFSLYVNCLHISLEVKVPRYSALFFAFFFLSFSLTANAQSIRRQLTVSLYPYIPNADNFYRKVETEFEKKYPQVDLIINLNQGYYDGLLSEEADVYEIDCILLKDFIKKQKIQELVTKNFQFKQDDQMPANSVTLVDKKLYAVPHWLCGSFLFYRASDTAMDKVSRLNDLEKVIGVDPSLKGGLLIDLKGSLGLGELYLDALFDQYHDLEKVKKHCSLANIDRITIDHLNKLPAMTYANWGRDSTYHDKGIFYQSQFARGNGRAYVGYSESLYDILREINLTCSKEDNCSDASSLKIKDFVLSDAQSTPIGWVDALAIDSKLTGQKLEDATTFINFMISVETYHMALIPGTDKTPRYLLPAYKQFYTDAAVLANAPYYIQLFPLASKINSFTDEGISSRLRQIGKALNKSYLKN